MSSSSAQTDRESSFSALRMGSRFTYWWEEEAGSGFCLIEGPDKESVEAAHRASHGMLPLNVVEVDEASIRGFFGRLNTHPPGEPYVESAFRAILFTDIVDSTRLTQSRDCGCASGWPRESP